MSLDGIGFFDNIDGADSCLFRDNRLSEGSLSGRSVTFGNSQRVIQSTSGALHKKVNTSAFKSFSLRESSAEAKVKVEQNSNGSSSTQGSATISSTNGGTTFSGTTYVNTTSSPGGSPTTTVRGEASLKISW